MLMPGLMTDGEPGRLESYGAMPSAAFEAPRQIQFDSIPLTMAGGEARAEPCVTDCLARPKRVLVVDDQECMRVAMERVLGSLGYQIEVASDGHEALAKLQLDVDLVVLDAAMPGMDGFQLTRSIRRDQHHGDVPIIMLTGSGSQKDRLRAVEAGVNDFVTKPFEINEIKLRSESLLGLKEATDALKRNGADLERKVEERTTALRGALEDMVAAQRRTQEAHLDTIRRLVLAAEYKHRDTAAHIERIGRYCEMIAQRLKLSPGEIEILRYASPMHDVGKIGIPDGILMKPGKLSGHEWQIMRTHPAIGAHILRGSRSPVMQAGEVIALTHHEKWDGSGYPAGISGERIPLYGRICAVADVFDALTTNREYRDALSTETVCNMLESEAGRHFDPQIVQAFLEDRRDVERIKTEFEEAGAGETVDLSQGWRS